MLLVSQLSVPIVIRSIQSLLEEATPNGDGSKNCIKSVASMGDCGGPDAFFKEAGCEGLAMTMPVSSKPPGDVAPAEELVRSLPNMFAACDVSSNRIAESLKRPC